MAKYTIRLASLFLLALCAGIAQESTGTISGIVTDPSGAPVPQAAITITNSQTGVTRKETTNASGNFVATSLMVGNYDLTA